MKHSPLFALALGLAFGTLLSALSGCAPAAPGNSAAAPASPAPVSDSGEFAGPVDEPSPEELARELGLPSEEGEPFGPNFGFSKRIPPTRVVSPEHYKDFRLHVEVFRKSTSNPVLGAFRDEYVDALVPNSAGMSDEAKRTEAKKRFASLASKEFAVVTVDGVPVKAQLVSAAVEQYVTLPVKGADGKPVRDPSTGQILTRRSFKTTPPGAYRLDPLIYEAKVERDGKRKLELVAFPWIRSRTYDNSQMYWGLWIHGGYFIHSTPHYGQLGQPASMGCIRQTFPDAMELFSHLVQEDMSGMIRIQKVGSDAAVAHLRELVFDAGFEPSRKSLEPKSAPSDVSKDMSWLLGQLATNAARIHDSVAYYGTSELMKKGHAWLDGQTRKPSPVVWPICGTEASGIDCFKPWGMRKP